MSCVGSERALDDRALTRIGTYCKALSSVPRVKVLAALVACGPLNPTRIATLTDQSQQIVSNSLTVLFDAGLVERRDTDASKDVRRVYEATQLGGAVLHTVQPLGRDVLGRADREIAAEAAHAVGAASLSLTPA